MKSEPFNQLTPNNFSPKSAHFLRIWLVLCMCMVLLMVCIGGITRLTESGLSIVEWKLLSGTLPPLSEQAWQEEFTAYQKSPEFIHKNAYFELTDFKRIFWLEYIHRLLGRLTGMIFLLPLLYVTIRQALPGFYIKRMAGITLLVGAQGLMGWIMVQSGLVDAPRVHPIKLAAHLLLAAAIFASLLFTYWHIKPPISPKQTARITPATHKFCLLVLVLFIIQFVLGAMTAGTDAGYSYNSYPLMDGRFIPNGLFALSPWWDNFISNITTVQFMHRIGALLLSAGVIALAFKVKKEVGNTSYLYQLLLLAITLQFSLGVFTLLSVVAIPLASLHQLAAFFLFYSILRILPLCRQ